MTNWARWVAAAVLFAAASVWAADLSSAKSGGQIGEKEDGYIGFVVAAPAPDVVALVNDVNAKRRAHYEKIAKQNGITRSDVEALAGQKAIEKTASGDYVFSGGRWLKK